MSRRSSLHVVVPRMGHESCDPVFEKASYSRFAYGFLAAQLVLYGMFQVDTLQSFMREHCRCSWRNVVSEGRWWSAISAHLCHRDLEHLAANLGTLLLPTFFLQGLLSSWSAWAVCVAAAAGGSAGSLMYVYSVFSPEEARRLGFSPWRAPLYSNREKLQTCDKGHGLQLVTPGPKTGSDVHCCDRCRKELRALDLVHRCGDCDFDLCIGCANAGANPALQFHHFKNAFDEFCFLRGTELAIGFDTMASERPYVTHPEAFNTAQRLDLREANEMCRPYFEWWEQSTRGSMGSSAVALALSALCALWFAELAWKGWRHPLLLLYPPAAAVQPMTDIVQLCRAWQKLRHGHGQAGSAFSGLGAVPDAEQSDAAGHLSGGAVGALAYCVLRRRGIQVAPLHPLVPAITRGG